MHRLPRMLPSARHFSRSSLTAYRALTERKASLAKSMIYRSMASGVSDSDLLQRTTAQCVIIGDEVLNGKCHDSNSYHLAKALFEQGVDLTRIHTIPDVQEVIVDTVQRASDSADYVFTSGGIGPTHDDITYQSIAEAFNVPLVLHQPTVDAMQETMAPGTVMNDARKRMALFPDNYQLHPTPGLWVPIVQIHNVYILPGVPRLFARMIDANIHLFQGRPCYRSIVHTASPEGDIADDLTRIAKQVADQGVSIGSYPKKAEPNSPGPKYSVHVSIEGRNKVLVCETAAQVLRAVRGTMLKDVDDPPLSQAGASDNAKAKL